MPKRLKRIYGFGHLHFLTFSCYRRLPLLRSARSRNFFDQVLRKVRDEYGFKLIGYVVMPEHIHLLISEPARGTPSTVLKMLKQRVSRRLRNKRRSAVGTQRSFRFASPDDRLPQFWQSRFYDFNVWSRKKKIEKLACMHANPVKRKLVQDPKNCPWSSYAFYQGRGEILVGLTRWIELPGTEAAKPRKRPHAHKPERGHPKRQRLNLGHPAAPESSARQHS